MTQELEPLGHSSQGNEDPWFTNPVYTLGEARQILSTWGMPDFHAIANAIPEYFEDQTVRTEMSINASLKIHEALAHGHFNLLSGASDVAQRLGFTIEISSEQIDAVNFLLQTRYEPSFNRPY